MFDNTSMDLEGRRRLSKSIIWVALTICVIALIAGAAELLAHLSQHPSTAAPPPALSVTAATPRWTDWPVTFSASGAIAAWQEASIGAQIGGYRVSEVNVNVGDEVRKGQVLARLDRSLLEASRAQLQATNDQAEINRQRALRLQAEGAISAQDVLQNLTQAKTSEAQLVSVNLQLRFTDIVAPDDGTISARTTTLGAVAGVGQEMFRLVRRDRIEWRGELTADQLQQVKPGQNIVLRLPDGSSAAAKVRETAPVLDAQSRLATVYADILPGSHARAGMYASAAVATGQKPALAVPASCVVIQDGHSYVFELTGEGPAKRAVARRVEVGRRQGELVEILSGISTLDELVATGAGFLDDGDIVSLISTLSTGDPSP